MAFLKVVTTQPARPGLPIVTNVVQLCSDLCSVFLCSERIAKSALLDRDLAIPLKEISLYSKLEAKCHNCQIQAAVGRVRLECCPPLVLGPKPLVSLILGLKDPGLWHLSCTTSTGPKDTGDPGLNCRIWQSGRNLSSYACRCFSSGREVFLHKKPGFLISPVPNC